MTLDEAMGDLKGVLEPIRKALSHVTREVRPSDTAFTELCKAVRLLQAEVTRLRERLELPRSVDHTAAVQEERAAVVRYVREERAVASGFGSAHLSAVADAIERGKHR